MLIDGKSLFYLMAASFFWFVVIFVLMPLGVYKVIGWPNVCILQIVSLLFVLGFAAAAIRRMLDARKVLDQK